MSTCMSVCVRRSDAKLVECGAMFTCVVSGVTGMSMDFIVYCTQFAVSIHCACVYTHFVLSSREYCVILHISVITQYGDSALILAAKLGYTEMLVELVKAKANLNLQNNVRSRLTVAIYCTCTCSSVKQ